MSCEFCEDGRDMRRVVGSAGCEVEEICIERILCFRAARYVGDKFFINVALPGSYAMTLPIRFCPMCGEQFPYNPHDSLESIKEDVTLSVCRYAKKRGFGHGKRDSDEEAICNRCEWSQQNCNLKMRMDVADRLGKLINEETER